MNVICIDGQVRQITTGRVDGTVGEFADRIAAALGYQLEGVFTLKLDGRLAHPDCPLRELAGADTVEQVGVGEADWYAIDEYGDLVPLPETAETAVPGAAVPVLDLDTATTPGEVAAPAPPAAAAEDLADDLDG